jgi:hypothetical protein
MPERIVPEPPARVSRRRDRERAAVSRRGLLALGAAAIATTRGPVGAHAMASPPFADGTWFSDATGWS